ncbi:alkaline phosphatase D family protein [Allomuricauda sp. SCSIO 65647]|uniref:alkaline phosphatase D family protein n=1 Tax=Allomuricauda sp. SCSIO 65647 TaxID=2908843 RepID=UPI001F18A8D0|nr:alkaline phosphatase D family protein [Muricauda sp. SCSIO 65647]UJH68545.1 alkaline phosphatase family protein [Muricauda sp. SCSIO 65647]
MKTKLAVACISFLVLYSCADSTKAKTDFKTTKIAFGSCGHEDHPLPIFNTVTEHSPDMFIFLGDNIYGDTKEMDTLRAKYQLLGAKPSYKNLKSQVPILATWDDHDYGWNDIGKSYPYKEESKQIFLDFFEEPESSQRREHKGIYHSYLYDYGDNTLQIILLDGRTFRDDLKPYGGEFDHDDRYDFYKKDYAPHTEATPTLLGEEQWNWLEKELQVPSDIKIIGSGTQFGIEWNGYEAWANFPHERKRMLDLIKSTKASGVLFISGDVHYSEISKLETDFYPIFDFTSSGLSSTWKFAAPNNNRIEGPIMDNHFGLITIQWNDGNTEIIMETWDIHDNQRIEYTVPLKSIQFKE